MHEESHLKWKSRLLKRAAWRLFEQGKQLEQQAKKLETDRLQQEKEAKIAAGDVQIIPAHSGSKSKSQARLDLEVKARDLGLNQKIINTMTSKQIEAILSCHT